MEKDLKAIKNDIESLKAWKRHCELAAAGWGGICMTLTTVGGLLYSYWEDIKHFFQGLGK